MAEKITVELDVDTTAIKQATVALRELAEAAERAKAAIDDLFGAPINHVDLALNEEIDDVMRPYLNGARPLGKGFKGL